MKKLISLLILVSLIAQAETINNQVVVKGGSDGTLIGNVGDAQKVTVVSGGGGGTVNQGSPNTIGNAWPIKITDGTHTLLINSDGSVQTGRTWTLSSGTDSVSCSVSNFPATQATNITQIAGATPSVTNYLPERITNGTSYVDPTQIRTLTTADTVTVAQPTAANLNGTMVTTGGATIAKDSSLTTINTTLGTPFQAGGNIGNTSFQATQPTAANLNGTMVTTGGSTIAKDSSLTTINTTLGTPFQAGGNIGNTSFQATQPTAANLNGTMVTTGGSTIATSANQTNGSQTTQLTTQAAASSSTVGSVSLGNSTGKTLQMFTGFISSGSTTVNQLIVSHTVTSGKTFYLQYFDCSANTEAAASTAAAFGTCSLQVGGVTQYTQYFHGAGTSGPFPVSVAEPLPVSSGTVIQWVTTPVAATAFFWYANFGGYEK